MSKQATEVTPNIHQRMLAVIRDAGALEKTGKATFGGGYQFHAIDAVVDHLRPIFAKHGVLAVPTALAHEESQGTDKMPFRSMTALRVRFVNVDDPSQFIESDGWGEGLDNQDKACGKSYSYALKTVLLGVCQLRGQPDNESDDKGEKAGRRIEERPKAGKPAAKQSPARLAYQLSAEERREVEHWLGMEDCDEYMVNLAKNLTMKDVLEHLRDFGAGSRDKVDAVLEACRERWPQDQPCDPVDWVTAGDLP